MAKLSKSRYNNFKTKKSHLNLIPDTASRKLMSLGTRYHHINVDFEMELLDNRPNAVGYQSYTQFQNQINAFVYIYLTRSG